MGRFIGAYYFKIILILIRWSNNCMPEMSFWNALLAYNHIIIYNISYNNKVDKISNLA